MHVVNAMFSKGFGGIEQSFLDYLHTLKKQNIKVTALIYPNCKVIEELNKIGVNYIKVKNLGNWDIFAKRYLKIILKQINPDCLIAHGNRAVHLLKKNCNKVKVPIIGVTHNYNLRKQIGVDAFFATTKTLKNELIKLGQAEQTIFEIPNMIKLVEPKIKEKSNPIVIGSLGRFLEKKGFDIFINALDELNKNNIDFKAVLGGSGKLENELKLQSQKLNLDDKLDFLGWINNKEDFYNSIDIFILPSNNEPFGIVLLEAFMYGKAVITTNSQGPSEIATHNHDSLVIPIEDCKEISSSVEKLINDDKLFLNLQQNSLQTVKKYEIDNVGEDIVKAIKKII